MCPFLCVWTLVFTTFFVNSEDVDEIFTVESSSSTLVKNKALVWTQTPLTPSIGSVGRH